ncbi:MAG: hypothetical protein WDO71_04295 [Bacteroidota bacterium]
MLIEEQKVATFHIPPDCIPCIKDIHWPFILMEEKNNCVVHGQVKRWIIRVPAHPEAS